MSLGGVGHVELTKGFFGLTSMHTNLKLYLKISFDFMKFLPSLYLNISNFPSISTLIFLHKVGFYVTFDSLV